jgi:hypothetical protein
MFERRHADRFRVPGATLRIFQNGNVSENYSVTDMTKSSIRFEITHSILKGEAVKVELNIPEMDSVTLKGYVIWAVDPQVDDNATAVVQFLPFGTDERYNSIECHEHLSRIVDKYSITTDNP